jgi:hypothetical protein
MKNPALRGGEYTRREFGGSDVDKVATYDDKTGRAYGADMRASVTQLLVRLMR